MIDPKDLRLPHHVRFLDPRVMRYDGEPLAAVAKRGSHALRLQHVGSAWTLTSWHATGTPSGRVTDWSRTLFVDSREHAIMTFMSIVAQLGLWEATIVIASPAALRP